MTFTESRAHLSDSAAQHLSRVSNWTGPVPLYGSSPMLYPSSFQFMSYGINCASRPEIVLHHFDVANSCNHVAQLSACFGKLQEGFPGSCWHRHVLKSKLTPHAYQHVHIRNHLSGCPSAVPGCLCNDAASGKAWLVHMPSWQLLLERCAADPLGW